MSEHPGTVQPNYTGREGSRFDGDTQIDLHMNTVSSYNPEAIRAAREAAEVAMIKEIDPIIAEIRSASHNLSNLTAVRRHTIGGAEEGRTA